MRIMNLLSLLAVLIAVVASSRAEPGLARARRATRGAEREQERVEGHASDVWRVIVCLRRVGARLGGVFRPATSGA